MTYNDIRISDIFHDLLNIIDALNEEVENSSQFIQYYLQDLFIVQLNEGNHPFFEIYEEKNKLIYTSGNYYYLWYSDKNNNLAYRIYAREGVTIIEYFFRDYSNIRIITDLNCEIYWTEERFGGIYANLDAENTKIQLVPTAKVLKQDVLLPKMEYIYINRL